MNNEYPISEEKILEIRKSVDIVDIISSYIPLIQKGKNYFGVCPFHSDHSPSMSVNKEKQIYKCFSCGAAGNVFRFVMDYENISFIEALKLLSDKAGVPININVNKKTKQNYNEIYQIYEISQKFYHNNLNTELGIKAKKYLNDRGINQEIIKTFEIGLALKDNSVLTNMLLKKKFSTKELLESGLISENNKGLYDIYHNRIMFPLYDLNGRIIGYSGRIYDSSDSSKYINTKETKIFKKGEILYNYHRAKESARIMNQIIVVEGFMDVIGLYKVGITNVVATMGTAVTKEQALLIKRMANNVILCFDGDEAGAHATHVCIDELKKIGVTPKIVRLEDNMDPDEYVIKYKDKIKSKIENPISIIDFRLQYLKRNIDVQDNIEYTKYIHDALNEVQKLNDPILEALTIQKLSTETGISIDLLNEQCEQIKTTVINEKPKKEIKNKINKYQKAEQNLMYYLLTYHDVATIVNNHKTFFPTDRYRHLAREVIAIYLENKNYEIADIITILEDNKEYTETINELLTLNLKEEYTKEEILDYIKLLSIYSIMNEKKRLMDLMKMEIEPIKKAEIANRIKELKIKEEEIKKEGI